MDIKNYKREWELRLNAKRFRGTTAQNIPEGWNPFDSDYSRITMSAPFRRLQDKAQVFPLEPNDFVRTRLTHSIEVAGVARSLGVRIEKWLLERSYIDQNKIGHIPSILSTASLAHDIGNPPFGHFGEKCIKDYFITNHSNSTIKLNEIEKADLENFDGNAQGLRLLLRLGLATDEFSFNLTFPTLATIIKYPRDSILGNKGKKEGISSKKFGYFQTEKKKYQTINKTLNLKNERHPLCYLLEAADDICYSVSDIEDGLKKGTINIEFLLETLRENFINDEECYQLEKVILKSIDKNRHQKNKISLVIQDCRIFAQIKMIDSTYNNFIENHDKIINGKYNFELLENSNSHKLRLFFEKIAHKNFNHESVIKSELLGKTVLNYLLDKFFISVFSNTYNDSKTAEGKIYSLISHQAVNAMNKTDYENKDYIKALMIIDFIASMTDSYALTLYQELSGMK